MAKKENRVSITKLDDYLKAQDTGVVHYELPYGDGKKLEFDVKLRLSIDEFHDAVHGVVSNAFVYDEATGLETYDAVQEYAAAVTYVMTAVANFKPDTATDKLIALYEIPEICSAFMVWEQAKEFENAVRKQIEWRQKELLSTERNLLDDATTKLDAATESFEAFVKMFEGVDPDAMMDVFNKVTNMSEFDLARGVLAAQPDKLTVVE